MSECDGSCGPGCANCDIERAAAQLSITDLYGANAKTIIERMVAEGGGKTIPFKMHNTVAEAAVLLAGKKLVPTPAILPPPPLGAKVGHYLVGADGHVYVVKQETKDGEDGVIELAPQEKQMKVARHRRPRPLRSKTNGHKLTPPGTQPKHKPWSIVK